MIDINAVINNAIINAVREAITQHTQGFTDLINQQAARITDLEEANACLVERVNDIARAVREASPAVPSSNIQLTREFVQHLDNQEWFWNKVNGHIERTMGDSATTQYVDSAISTAFETHNELYGHASGISQEDAERIAFRIARRALEDHEEEHRHETYDEMFTEPDFIEQFDELLTSRLEEGEVADQIKTMIGEKVEGMKVRIQLD